MGLHAKTRAMQGLVWWVHTSWAAPARAVTPPPPASQPSVRAPGQGRKPLDADRDRAGGAPGGRRGAQRSAHRRARGQQHREGVQACSRRAQDSICSASARPGTDRFCLALWAGMTAHPTAIARDSGCCPLTARPTAFVKSRRGSRDGVSAHTKEELCCSSDVAVFPARGVRNRSSCSSRLRRDCLWTAGSKRGARPKQSFSMPSPARAW